LVFRSFNPEWMIRLLKTAGLKPVTTVKPVSKVGVPSLQGQPIMMWIAHKPFAASESSTHDEEVSRK